MILTSFSIFINNSYDLSNLINVTNGDFIMTDEYNILYENGIWSPVQILTPGRGYWGKFKNKISIIIEGLEFEEFEDYRLVFENKTVQAFGLKHRFNMSLNEINCTDGDLFNAIYDIIVCKNGVWPIGSQLESGKGYFLKNKTI